MPFRDVPAGAYYAQPVLWAYHAGVVNGCGADTFCPTQAISRQDLTVILYRYACLTGIADAAQSENVLSGFADAGAVSDYARAALAWAVENGIVYGWLSATPGCEAWTICLASGKSWCSTWPTW